MICVRQLGQVFPPEGKENEYSLDLSLYMEEDLTSINGDVTFPLIIRLETVTDTSVEVCLFGCCLCDCVRL